MNSAIWLVLCLTLICVSCMTDPTTGETVPDWEVIEGELSLMQADIGDLANAADAENPEAAAALRQLVQHLGVVERGVAAYRAGAPVGADVFAAIDAALVLTGEFVDDEDQVWVTLARIVLRRVRAYLPQN